MVPQASFISKVWIGNLELWAILFVLTTAIHGGFWYNEKQQKEWPMFSSSFLEQNWKYLSAQRLVLDIRFSLFELKALVGVLKSISLWLSLSELKRTVGFLPSIVLYLRVRADRLFPNSRHCGSAKPAGAVAFEIMVTKHLRVGTGVHFANFHNGISGFGKKRRRFFIQIMGPWRKKVITQDLSHG